MVISTKYKIKIPLNVKILYCKKKQILTVIGPLSRKSLRLEFELEILESEKTILVTSVPVKTLSNSQKKKISAKKGTTVALIKQLLVESSSILYQKLKFVGVGYRAFDVDEFKNQLIMFKLGYSHPIYFKIPKNTNLFCLKLTKLFIFGNSYHTLTQISSLIQSYKSPEPYKGKGILYENEKIILKEGKKI